MQPTWLSLLPPIIVIAVVCITQRLATSLIIGIISAALITTHGNIMSALIMCMQRCVAHFIDGDNLYVYGALVVISSLITLLTVTGSAAGCARIIGKRMRTAKSVELSTVTLAFLLSIDDYLSILTVGFVMKPIADRCAVARTKLAYIVHALAGPLVMIMPISTWAAAVLVQLDNAGIQLNAPHKIIADPFYVYFKTIPFIFYSLLVVISVCFIVITRISYGAIARDEHLLTRHAQKVHAEPIDQHNNHSLAELLMPIIILIGGLFLGILYAGDYHLFGGTNSLFEAFKHNNKTFLIFLCSGLSAFTVSIIFSLYKKMIKIADIPIIVWQGIELIKGSVIVIALASVLGSFLRIDLQTGSFIAHLLLDTVSLCLIPVMLFVVSLVITLVTGSAWGTFSLLIPITTQMLITLLHLDTPVSLDQLSLLFPSLGAVLSGAACGNHISPFAETTVMTAVSTGIEPLKHAKTQYEYVVPVIIGSLVAFIIVGFLYTIGLYKSFLIAMSTGCLVSIGLLMIADWIGRRV
jgi:tetracycline resistance efflux pump